MRRRGDGSAHAGDDVERVVTLDIRSGGAIAVDPDSLREAASRLDGAGDVLDIAAAAATTAMQEVSSIAELTASQVVRAASLMARMEEAVRDLATRTRRTADAYELVELRIQLQLMVAWPRSGPEAESEWERVDRRFQRIAERNPAAVDEAERVWQQWRQEYGDEFVRQWALSMGDVNAIIPGLGLGAFAASVPLRRAVRSLGLGVVPRGAKLQGQPPPVQVMRTLRSQAGAAPETLGEAARRIPDVGPARVRVEKYTMPDGSRQFAVYLGGTGGGDRSAWSWESNSQLYSGRMSASFAATLTALERAGAKPGDVLHTFGFSQGAMIGARLEAAGEYDVRTLVALGSPVDVQADPNTLSVAVRHSDDPVALLAGGGMPAGSGSPESLVVERVDHPLAGLRDVLVPAHRLEEYADTAAMLDESDDPRVEPVRDVLQSLGEAVDVQVSEYRAMPVDPDS